MKLITANRLSDGAVVYLGERGSIVGRLEAAHRFAPADVEAALARATARSGEIVGVYAIDVDDAAPIGRDALRESIRMNGPTIRRDLGKQAEFHDERL